MEAFQALSAKLSQIPGLEVRAHEPMAHHTTFRVGGPAALMALPKRLEELSAVLRAELFIPRMRAKKVIIQKTHDLFGYFLQKIYIESYLRLNKVVKNRLKKFIIECIIYLIIHH